MNDVDYWFFQFCYRYINIFYNYNANNYYNNYNG